MRALITGGAGFIGSHLSDLIMGADERNCVTCVDDLSTGSLDNIRHMLGRPGFQFVRESVCNAVTMVQLVDRCDVIFHLAAAVGVKLIVDQPVRTIETNIHGSEVVLELANKFSRKTLLASTSEVYGKSNRVPFAEEDDVVLGSTRLSRWCYACSKMVDEFLALAYHDQFGLHTVVCRLFNTVGPRQTGAYGMVVPRFVRAALRGEPLQVYGTGAQSRCFSSVNDVVAAMMRLVECDDAVGEIVNVGTTESITIEALADLVLEMTGSGSSKQHLTYEQAYGRPFDDMMQRTPDLTKIRRLIGYEPKVTLRETLQKVIDYEKKRLG
ncbi:MAG: GDP-mannose 4,6-dehydratase [Planctomycetes bacterium]|nr:GDP-mannose 4,6-dehydratase [Planctomycetota bacterium]